MDSSNSVQSLCFGANNATHRAGGGGRSTETLTYPTAIHEGLLYARHWGCPWEQTGLESRGKAGMRLPDAGLHTTVHQGLAMVKMAISEIKCNLRFLGMKDWRVRKPGTAQRRKWG